MIGKIALLTILADDVPAMLKFYRDVLGFTVQSDHGSYVELENEGVRFAVCSRATMVDATQHPSYTTGRSGQAFELAFPVASPEAVDTTYEEIIARGATPIKGAETMPWGMRTAFFADPEGNIHELFAYPPSAV